MKISCVTYQLKYRYFSKVVLHKFMQAVLLQLLVKTSYCGDSLSLLFTIYQWLLQGLSAPILYVAGKKKHCGFLFVSGLIPVSNQRSQEWKQRAALSLLAWLPNEMKHADAISQGIQSIDARGVWKREIQTYSTEADCDVSRRQLSPLENFCESTDQQRKLKITAPN